MLCWGCSLIENFQSSYLGEMWGRSSRPINDSETQSIRKIECPGKKARESDPKLSASECCKMMSWSIMERSDIISTWA